MFNGNNYDSNERSQLISRGLWNIDSTIETICRFTADKNFRLFEDMGIFTPEECRARQSVMLSQYIGVVGEKIEIIPRCI